MCYIHTIYLLRPMINLKMQLCLMKRNIIFTEKFQLNKKPKLKTISILWALNLQAFLSTQPAHTTGSSTCSKTNPGSGPGNTADLPCLHKAFSLLKSSCTLFFKNENRKIFFPKTTICYPQTIWRMLLLEMNWSYCWVHTTSGVLPPLWKTLYKSPKGLKDHKNYNYDAEGEPLLLML